MKPFIVDPIFHRYTISLSQPITLAWKKIPD